MYQYISADSVIWSDRGKYSQVIFGERIIKSADHIVFAAEIADVESVDHSIIIWRSVISGIDNNSAGDIDHFDAGIHIVADRFKVPMEVCQFHTAVVIIQRVSGSNFCAFRIQCAGLQGFYLISKSVICYGRYKSKSKQTKYKVA